MLAHPGAVVDEGLPMLALLLGFPLPELALRLFCKQMLPPGPNLSLIPLKLVQVNHLFPPRTFVSASSARMEPRHQLSALNVAHFEEQR